MWLFGDSDLIPSYSKIVHDLNEMEVAMKCDRIKVFEKFLGHFLDRNDLDLVVKQISIYSPSSKLVYTSTDSIFNGIKGNYKETDVPEPMNYYAKSKFDGELQALKLFNNSMVLRTNIYGFHLPKSNSLAEWAINNLKKNAIISGFNDVHFNPVYTKQFAEVLFKLVTLNFSGILNVASNNFISKYAFLQEIAKMFYFDPEIIQACSINESKFKAIRPNNTTLNTDFLSETLGNVPDFFDGMYQFRLDYNNAFNK